MPLQVLFTSHHKQAEAVFNVIMRSFAFGFHKIHVFPKLKGKTVYQPYHFFFTDYLKRAIDKFSAAAEQFFERVKSVDVSE